MPLRPIEDERAHETALVVDLGAKHQPFRGLLVDAADASFFRGVVVEARSQPASPHEEPHWRPLTEASLYRYVEDGQPHERLRIDVAGRERMLRLRIRNRDDRPLQLRRLAVLTPLERLVFDAEPGHSYRLTYGSEALDAPVYDVARTVGDPAIWIAQAVPGHLGAPVWKAGAAGRPPWTERHPALVWAGLCALVLLLGTVTWRALRAAGRPEGGPNATPDTMDR